MFSTAVWNKLVFPALYQELEGRWGEEEGERELQTTTLVYHKTNMELQSVCMCNHKVCVWHTHLSQSGWQHQGLKIDKFPFTHRYTNVR